MKLRKHKDRDVAELSEKVTNKWLSHYTAKLTQPSLEVKCDHETEQIRSSGRKHLRKALQSSSEVQVRLTLRSGIHGNFLIDTTVLFEFRKICML